MASYRDALPCDSVIHAFGKQHRFRLIKQVGEGGMAKVYLAELPDGRNVALKFPHAEMMGNEMVIKRFLEESKLSIKFKHPNILRAYTYGLDQEKTPVIAMEYVPQSKTLADVVVSAYDQFYANGIRRSPETGLVQESLLPKELILEIMIQICLSVQELHSKDVIHRDQKPDNYLVVKEDPIHLKLADFGIAKRFAEGRPDLTQGSVVGTVYYMAPEQVGDYLQLDAEGHIVKAWKAGKYSDVWAIGVILYELISGTYPFCTDENDSAEIMTMISDRDNEPAPIELSVANPDPELTDLAMDILIKDPSKRPTIEQLITRLRDLKAKQPHVAMSAPVSVKTVTAPVPVPVASGPRDALASVPNVDRASFSGGRNAPEVFAPTISVTPMPPSSPSPPKAAVVPVPVQVKLSQAPVRVHTELSSRMIAIVAIAAAAFGIMAIGSYVFHKGESVTRATDTVYTAASTNAQVATKTVHEIGEAVASAAVAPLASALERTPEPEDKDPAPEGSAEADTAPLMSAAVPLPEPGDVRPAGTQLSRGSKYERWFRSGARYALRGNCDAALSYLYRVQMGNPKYPETYRYLGDCARLRKKTSEARDLYKTYLSYFGTSPLVLTKEAQAILNR